MAASQERNRLNTFDEALEAVKQGNFVIVVVSFAQFDTECGMM